MVVSTASAPRLRPKKSLGQNFLRDPNIARKIVAAASPHRSDVMLEIGPGEGALTKHLVSHVQQLIVVDIDRRATDRLREMFPAGDLEILNENFLELDLAGVARRADQPLRIIGNIPYNITSPILFHLLDNRTVVADTTLMMQKEVARRIVARPHSKDYGILSVICQLLTDTMLLFDVSANAFFPKPKVTSSVVQLTMRKAPRYAVTDEQFFRRMVRALFGKRRKTLRNSLAYFVEREGIRMPEAAEVVDLKRRPENLDLEEFVHLSNVLCRTTA